MGTDKTLAPDVLSAVFSNLAKACSKQLRTEEAGLFTELANYYQSNAASLTDQDFNQLLEAVQSDLTEDYPACFEAASEQADRGSLRALTWSEKVTKIHKSAVGRYERQQEALLEKASVFICDACGFVFIGSDMPDICPICKAPRSRFEAV